VCILFKSHNFSRIIVIKIEGETMHTRYFSVINSLGAGYCSVKRVHRAVL